MSAQLPPKSSKSGRQERNKAGPMTNKVLVTSSSVSATSSFSAMDGRWRLPARRLLGSSCSMLVRLIFYSVLAVGSSAQRRSESASGSAHGRQSHQREKMAVGRWPRSSVIHEADIRLFCLDRRLSCRRREGRVRLNARTQRPGPVGGAVAISLFMLLCLDVVWASRI